MKKQLKVSLVAGAAVLAAAAIAQAAPQEINIFGASAQYDFWNAQAQNYATHLGCTAPAAVTLGGKYGIVKATGCSSALVPATVDNPGRDLSIRYAGIASIEGPLSAKRAAPLDPALATGCNIANGERLMLNDAGTAANVCKTVHIGTADVKGEALIQYSEGDKTGPQNSGTYVVNSLSGVPMQGVSGITAYSTVVVPFGFFVNKSVTAQTCTAGLIGNYCTANAQCNNNKATDGVCGSAKTITNISRIQAAQIFSAQAADWSDFGAYFTPQQIVACLRHAGSGTHSSLDFTVLNAGGSGWGTQVVQFEDTTGNAGKISAGGLPQIFFNQGSSDELKCINGIGLITGAGAIGYADADADLTSYTNVAPLAYNGVYPTRTAVRNGLYDFYSPAQLYTNSANGATINGVAVDMINFAKLPGNIPGSKVNYWAALGEMNYGRATVANYPAKVTATNPQTP